MTSLDAMRAFIGSVRWIFARTMPQTPHWYTLRKENPQEGFETFVMFIREQGYEKQFGNARYTYLDDDGWSYWTMGAPLEKTILINRARIEVPADR